MPLSRVKPPYGKPPQSLDAQADLLFSRGLSGIEKPSLVERLARVNYYRWRGYTYPYQDNSRPDAPFLSGTSWAFIEADYSFDRDLRILVFEVIERIEVSLRTQLALHGSLDHGAAWYADQRLFHNYAAWTRDQADLCADWDRSKELFVEHHKTTYADGDPPAWKIFETTSLGALSKFFENLKRDLPCKHRIAAFWGFGRHETMVLSSWFHHLNLVRNICAHHGRLYNRVIKVTPLFPKKMRRPWVSSWPDANRVFASICILVDLLGPSAPEFDPLLKLRPLIARLRPGQLPSLGFPIDWEAQALFSKGSAP